MKKLILIDSNALVHRAFHALPPLNSPKGVMTNAVFGFTSVLFKMFKDLKPDYVAATFDLAGPTFRHEEFAEYKIHREKAPDELYNQIPLIKEIVRAMGIPVYEKEGFEADDLIGSLAEKVKKEKNLQTIIVTGDLDTLQLVDKDRVVVFTLKKGITDTIIYNEKSVIERYGLGPSQVTDFKGLKGDPSDNIPGVPGVGDKTASALIKEFGSIENLYKKISGNGKTKTKSSFSEKLVQKLLDNKDQAFFSKKLATINCEVDFSFKISDADWAAKINKPEFERLLKEFGFFSLLKRIPEVYNNLDGNVPNPQAELSLPTDKVKPNIISQKEIGPVLENMAKARELYFDIDDRGIFSFTQNGSDSYSFDVGDLMESKGGAELWSKFVKIFESEKMDKISHGLKEVIKKFIEKDIDFKGEKFDTKLAFYLLNPDLKDYSLGQAYYLEFGKDFEAEGILRPQAIYELKSNLEKKIKKEALEEVLYGIEIPLAKVLARMEIKGIKIDQSSLSKLSQMVNQEIVEIEKEIYKEAGTTFNINSPQQLGDVLYERLQLKTKVKKTSTGAKSTAAAELEKLLGEHPIIEKIMKHRELQKLKTTYIEPFPALIDKKTGCLHTTFNQAGSATGRLSSQDPNLQNIPIKTELGLEFRKSFVASPGHKLVSFDYSQLELRIAAEISKDKKMTAAFKRGEDIHTRTASEIFQVEPKAVTAQMRRQAKVMNFGLIYGMGVLGFQRASGVSREKAHEFIRAYMTEFSGVAKYMQDMKIFAKKNGYVQTLFGRKRYLPEMLSNMPQLIAQAERIAINMPIQGTASDVVKMAMIKIYDWIRAKDYVNDVRLVLQVHDELLFEIKNDLVDKTVKEIKSLMEKSAELSVPLIVDAKYGDNWRDMELI